ncbi:hypothetical protein [Halorussus halophilus]|uniref:hypothetical protein n=1 Tax=Halorussus halophilus TaxID=2650975 RepID=UPI0013019543|nr:hypothetical protein [Halorussus halophilus]
MVELDRDALAEIDRRRDSLATREFVSLVERHHPHDQPGIPRDVLDAYVEELAGASGTISTPQITRWIDERLTDEEIWVDDGLYEVEPGHVSVFPRRWHDHLDGETDLREYVRFVLGEESGYREATGQHRSGAGVPRQLLVEAAVVLGGLHRADALDQYRTRRQARELIAYPDQNPEAEVRLPEAEQ